MTDAWPDGFAYYPDALTETEEADLLRFIDTLDLGPFVHMGNPSLRHVRNFGVDFDYERKIAVEAPPIPDAFNTVLDRVAALTGTPRGDLAELLVTRYTPGASITWHRELQALRGDFRRLAARRCAAEAAAREPEKRPADPDRAGGAAVGLCADRACAQQMAAPCAAGQGNADFPDHPHSAAGAGHPSGRRSGAVSGAGAGRLGPAPARYGHSFATMVSTSYCATTSSR